MPDNNPVNDQRISLFLRKLWTLVNSPETDNVIKWNKEGDGFIIPNQVELCGILPKYFKHNNFMSFVRQLHIYGFSKRISDADHTSHHGTSSEYAHPYFMKDHPCLLLSIKQKRGDKVHQNIKSDIDSIDTINTLIEEVNAVKDKNKILDAKFLSMKHENECLWRELAVIRQKHMKQQRILNQLIQFLVTLRQPGTNNNLCREVKNNVRYVLPIMHHKTSEKENSNETFANQKYKPSTSSGPVIHELDATDISSSNNVGKGRGPILCNENVEAEGVVLSPNSVSQMLSSPGGSTVEEIFAPNEIPINSPLDQLIREVSVSPIEELLDPNPNTVTVSSLSSNNEMKSTNTTNKSKKKKAKADINPKRKKKSTLVDFDKLQPVPKSIPYTPYIIKLEPSENDPPVISIPEMDFIEPEVIISNNNEEVCNYDTTTNNDNMQLVHSEAKDAVCKQIDTVQSDLDNLLKGLNDTYTFDASTFLNYINDDPSNLNLPIKSEEQTFNDAKNGLNVTPDNQIVSCLSPNTYDLNDLMTASADWSVPSTPISFDTAIGSDGLNTPVMTDSLLNSESIFPSTTLPD